MREQLKAIDFFSGVGGLTRGLLNARVGVRAGVDSDESCRETFEFNNESAEFISTDIRQLDRSIVRNLVREEGKNNMLFTGCAPCQSFSKQRRSKSRRPDATVLGSFAELVEEFQPAYVLIENVPGLRSVKGFSTYKRFKRMLTTNGYGVSEDVVNANEYGVAQSRRRLILVAALGAEISLPERTHDGKNVPFATVRETIGHYPALKAGGSSQTVANHVAAELSDLNLRRIQNTPQDGGDRRDWPEELWLDCHKGEYSGHSDVYGRMFWDRPSPTLTGRCVSISNGRYGHPSQNRAISLREAAALQSFDDDFTFSGHIRQIALHIGNAVPVLLAEKLGRHIAAHHKGKRK